MAPGWFEGDDYGWIHSEDQLAAIHGIPTHIVMKAACIFFNVDRTGQDQAIFVQNEAARSWPIQSGMSDKYLPNPMNIAGPTYEIVIFRTHVDANETVQSFLKRVQAEQKETVHGIHAPFRQIQKALMDRWPERASDGLVFVQLQEFNFIPNLDYQPRKGRTSCEEYSSCLALTSVSVGPAGRRPHPAFTLARRMMMHSSEQRMLKQQ